MHINKLTIKNYRSFRNFEVELKPFTLVIGENNIGKTNFLNAIGLIFSQDITFFKKRNLELGDINYEAINSFKKDISNLEKDVNDIVIPRVEVVAEMVCFNEDQESIVADWAINADLDKAKLTYTFYPKEDLKNWIENEREKIKTITIYEGETNDEYLKRIEHNISFPINKYGYTIYGGLNETKQVDLFFLKMLKYEYVGAIRDVKKELLSKGGNSLLFKILSNRGEGKYLDIINAVSELDKAVKENQELKDIEEQISAYLAKTSLVEDESYNKVDFHFSNIEEYDILRKLSLLYGNSPIKIDHNGTGRNNLLYMSLLLSHLINSQEDGIYYRLIGIEEPEAHLHPHLQEHLASNIKEEISENMQIIVTSHSTHITSKLPLESTVIFFNEKESIRNHYITDGFARFKNGKLRSKSKKHINYLEKYLDSTKSTMFFARRIILVEGIAEHILVPLLFKMYSGSSLEKAGCTMINVNGVAFSHFLEIIKNGYFKKCLTLTDSDQGKKTEIRAPQLKAKYSNDQISISITDKTDTLEKELIFFNKNGFGKDILLKALRRTRPVLGNDLKKKYQDKNLEVEPFFEIIESYKADFATDLRFVLENLTLSQRSDFVIPKYILDGFQHLFI